MIAQKRRYFLNSLFLKGKGVEALKTVLRNAPVSSRNQMLKVWITPTWFPHHHLLIIYISFRMLLVIWPWGSSSQSKHLRWRRQSALWIGNSWTSSWSTSTRALRPLLKVPVDTCWLGMKKSMQWPASAASSGSWRTRNVFEQKGSKRNMICPIFEKSFLSFVFEAKNVCDTYKKEQKKMSRCGINIKFSLNGQKKGQSWGKKEAGPTWQHATHSAATKSTGWVKRERERDCT